MIQNGCNYVRGSSFISIMSSMKMVREILDKIIECVIREKEGKMPVERAVYGAADIRGGKCKW